MLRIVLKLDDVKMAVVRPHEMGLRSATHPPNVLHRLDRQASKFSDKKKISKLFYWTGVIAGKKQINWHRKSGQDI